MRRSQVGAAHPPRANSSTVRPIIGVARQRRLGTTASQHRVGRFVERRGAVRRGDRREAGSLTAASARGVGADDQATSTATATPTIWILRNPNSAWLVADPDVIAAGIMAERVCVDDSWRLLTVPYALPKHPPSNTNDGQEPVPADGAGVKYDPCVAGALHPDGSHRAGRAAVESRNVGVATSAKA